MCSNNSNLLHECFFAHIHLRRSTAKNDKLILVGKNGNARKRINWLSWEKLSLKNENGDMGFRHLHGFNLVMLGRQGWKLTTNQDVMVTKFFKLNILQIVILWIPMLSIILVSFGVASMLHGYYQRGNKMESREWQINFCLESTMDLLF